MEGFHMVATRRSLLLSSIALFGAPYAVHCAARAQAKPGAPDVVAGIPVNYDESLVGDVVLPDPLTASDGTTIATRQAWVTKRRPEILELFEEQQFGRVPGKPAALAFHVQDKGTPAFDGKAIRKQVNITFTRNKSGPSIQLLVYTPAAVKKPVPLLLVMGWGANGAAVDDPGVLSNPVWNPKEKKRLPYVPAQGARGFGRLDVLPLIDAGFGVATFNYGDVDPDDLQGFDEGVRKLFLKPGETKPAPDEWGAIAAWGWGISRVIDYFETDKAVDARRIAIHGVSRLGKTVMWAGARDTRVAATIASCSGEGGAAVSRRNYGETIAHLTAPTRYPYQFAANYAKWAGFPDRAPMDGNLLVALHAPRPLLLQTGTTDGWSDPKGEFIAAVDAGKVWRLFGKRDLGTDAMPAPNQPILHDLGYLMHEGGHGTIPADWPVFIDFLKLHLQPGT
jgi:hypothetical protein